MKILANYLRKQTIRTSLVVLSLLFLLMIGTLFTSTLRAIARGILPPELLFIELSLRSVDVLTILIPLSFYLGVLVSLSQLYRNQEAVMMHAVGWSSKDLFRALQPLMWLVFGLMLVVSLVIAPEAARLSKELTTQANEKISLMGLTEGKFQKFFSDEGVIFVEKVDVEQQRVENVFANIHHPDRIDTLTAEYGYQFEENDQKYVALFNGYRNEGVPGTNAYQMMQFERNDIKLPDLDQQIAALDEKSKPTVELLQSDAVTDQAQLHWRLSPAFSLLALFVLAVGLSKTSHREAKFINLVVGILAYAFMVNLLTIGHSLLEQGELPMSLGLWWVYGILGGYGLWRLLKNDGPKLSLKTVGSKA
ncbi:LPS export ABC transporter permease LptF [Marinicella meishanensis]|uniref:LPS export ABC transporter permease LptF n=1 Tax=Marinicella meishanensis TaxID=2873263 RepID=UPI001CC020F5|nr:LPS export ABC transporter permease LptF [Marinicella sp. NBU2979]